MEARTLYFLSTSVPERFSLPALLPCLRGLGLAASLLPQVLPPDRDRLLFIELFTPSSPNKSSFFIFSSIIDVNGEIVLMSSLHFSKTFGDNSSSSASVFNKNVNGNIRNILEKIPRPGPGPTMSWCEVERPAEWVVWFKGSFLQED